MKLIITGATGYVATEVLRQALLLPSITSVVALARKSVSSPAGISEASASKLKSVVVKDYGSYPDDTRNELAGADACIWTVAITPSKAKAQDPEIAILEANPAPKQPLKFLYMPGTAAKDPVYPRSKETEVWLHTKLPQFMIDYGNVRGETATKLYSIAEESKGQAEVCVAKPGLITGDRGLMRGLFGIFLWLTGLLDTVDLKELSAAMLYHAVNGFKGTEGILLNAELSQLGREVLSGNEKS